MSMPSFFDLTCAITCVVMFCLGIGVGIWVADLRDVSDEDL